MTCAEREEDLALDAMEALEEPARAGLRAHVRACPACAEREAATRKTAALLHRLGAAMRSGEAPRRAPGPLAAAAAVLIIALPVLWGLGTGRDLAPRPASQEESARLLDALRGLPEAAMRVDRLKLEGGALARLDESGRRRVAAAAHAGLPPEGRRLLLDPELPSWLARPLLGDADAGLRAAALERLGAAELATADLEPLLSDPDQVVRVWAADRAGETGNAALLPSLRGRLSDPDDQVRVRLYLALGRLGGPAEAALLLEAAGRERAAALGVALGLGELMRRGALDPKAAAGAADGLLEHPDPMVRIQCLSMLEELGAVSRLPRIESRLADEEDWVRSAAGRLLGRMGGASSRGPLRQALQSEKDEATRKVLGQALAELEARLDD